MDEPTTETSADAPSVGIPTAHPLSVTTSPDEPLPAPAHLATTDPVPAARPRRRWLLLVGIGLPVLALIGLIVAWAVDTSAGGVARNVTLAGADVSKLSETRLATTVAEIGDDFAELPVTITSDDGEPISSTAGELGLSINEQASVRSALEVDGDTTPPLRPFTWMASLLSEREAPLEFQVSEEQTAAALVELDTLRTAPTEPSVSVSDGTLSVVSGADGTGIPPDALAEALRDAAAAWTVDDDQLTVDVPAGPLPPMATDDAANTALSDAEDLIGEPVEIRTSAGNRTIEPAEMLTWVTLTSQPGGNVAVELNPTEVDKVLRRRFADIEGAPVDASVMLDGSTPVVRPEVRGRVCCGDTAASDILEALSNSQRSIELDLVEGRANVTTEMAEGWGVVEPVGGSRAWRSGADVPGPAPGFTTYYQPGQARVRNIRRMADLVRGAVVPPGGEFSINDHVGPRTTEKGFVSAGAIRNGEHVDEVGGGVSQFATTLFNAAYFAGLDILEYQAHSEYFDRYPRGREATMGHPAPDLRFKNNTPYGLLIGTSYSDDSLTITIYSTQHIDAEQTGITESMSGACRVVTTTRTRTFPDGRSANDTFRATYRPGEGRTC